MASELVLYDLPSKPGTGGCWSANTWRVRMVLNYKQIPYRTEWVEFPDIEPKFKALGIPPHKDFAPWTVPVVKFPDGSYVMHSTAITKRIELEHPTPSLHLDTGYQDIGLEVFDLLLGPLRPVFMPRVRRNLLREGSEAWFLADRERRFKLPEAEWEARDGGPEAFQAAKPGYNLRRELLTKYKKDEGPFVLGSVPCYADFIVAGVGRMFEILGIFEQTWENDEVAMKQYEACRPWLKRCEE